MAAVEWVRNVRGYPSKPGLWHRRKDQANRVWFGDKGAACGFYPDQSPQTGTPDPTDRVCPKCAPSDRNPRSTTP